MASGTSLIRGLETKVVVRKTIDTDFVALVEETFYYAEDLRSLLSGLLQSDPSKRLSTK
jgi:hypothetical protein